MTPALAAVVGVKVVVDARKFWPILLIILQVFSIPPDICPARASAVVHRDLRSEFGRYYFIDKAFDLV